MRFFKISTFLLIMGIKYEYLWHDGKGLFTVLHELGFFFANFGPNSTSFIWPAELFATRLRSTFHALSAVARKVGVIVAAFICSLTHWMRRRARLNTWWFWVLQMYWGILFHFYVAGGGGEVDWGNIQRGWLCHKFPKKYVRRESNPLEAMTV